MSYGKCESCGAPATGLSLDEIPLCARCGKSLEQSDRTDLHDEAERAANGLPSQWEDTLREALAEKSETIAALQAREAELVAALESAEAKLAEALGLLKRIASAESQEQLQAETVDGFSSVLLGVFDSINRFLASTQPREALAPAKMEDEG